MTVTIEILHQSVLELLRKLEGEHMIRMETTQSPESGKSVESVRTFNAISIDTRGFKFSREEANER